MTSVCETTHPIQPLQEVMINCLVYHPSNQHPENMHDSETIMPSSIYWTEDLAISGSSSTLSRYHTALAVGATVVCSAGAIMQHTDVGFWPQPATTIPVAENTIGLKQSDADTQVLTPPIDGPQLRAAFSTAAAENNSTCHDSTCKGLAFIEKRLPEIQAQVRELRTEMQQFQTQHTSQNLQTYRSILAYRSNDVARRQAELAGKSQQLEQQFISLTAVLALQPNEANQIANLLKTDTTYQRRLQQLQALEQEIAIEYSNLDLNNEQLEILYTEYAQMAEQLRQIAQTVLVNYVSAASVEFSDPLWQEDSYQALLQELMDLSHLRQMLVVEQHTLAQIEIKLVERRDELAVLLKEYATMQRQLESQNKILQQYVDRRQVLRNNLT